MFLFKSTNTVRNVKGFGDNFQLYTACLFWDPFRAATYAFCVKIFADDVSNICQHRRTNKSLRQKYQLVNVGSLFPVPLGSLK